MRILVVEDNQKIATVIKDILVTESFAVDIGNTAQEGLDLALSEDYDLINLDRMLTDNIDGIEICKTLRQAKKYTLILMLTARDQVQQRVEGLNAGADDYLVKPFSFEELLARINALLRRPHTAIEEVLQVGNLKLNIITKKVKRKGKLITLTAKEYALLEYLMRNKGKTMSKQNILDHVWDFEADILPNTIEANMTR